MDNNPRSTGVHATLAIVPTTKADNNTTDVPIHMSTCYDWYTTPVSIRRRCTEHHNTVFEVRVTFSTAWTTSSESGIWIDRTN